MSNVFLNDYIIIDDFFDDPNSIIEKAKSLKFYNLNEHPTDNNNGLIWIGKRTEYLHNVDLNFINEINNTKFNKILKQSDIEYMYQMSGCFHLTTKNDGEFNNNWIHKDRALYAGVVFLNKNPKKNSGTILFNGDKEIILDNIFNRFVMYKSWIPHAPQNFFGNDINDGRLTYVFFINSITLGRE